MSDNLRIIFAGTPDFAATHLSALLKTDHDICAVFTQPDRPAGRGRQLQQSPVKEVALAAGIDVMQPTSLRNAESQQLIAQLNADLMIVVAYGLIIPADILTTPKLGCWNVHASLLPRWRGAAPIQRAILAGDKETGVTIMQMDEGLDTGDMLLKATCPILETDNSQSLHQRLADLGADTLLNALANYQTLTPEKQTTEHSYAKKIAKTEAVIDWHDSAINIVNKVRAFNPWPITETTLGKDRIRIWQAKAIDTAAEYSPGKVISIDRNGILVATQDQCLLLEKIQLPGKKPLTALDLLNGNQLSIAPGDRLGK